MWETGGKKKPRRTHEEEPVAEERIVGVLREHERGTPTDELCRRHGIRPRTRYRWKAKYGGMSVPDAQRLKAPEDENRPKKLVANQAGGHQRAEGRRLAKLVTPAARKPFVQDVREEWQLSERRACELMEVSTMAMRYMSRRDDTVLRRRLRELAAQRRAGATECCVLLLREGMHVNHKRVERDLPRGRPERAQAEAEAGGACRGDATPAASRPDEAWGLDVVSNALSWGRKLRALTGVDFYTREALAIEVDTSLSGVRVARVLDRVIRERGQALQAIVMDNGPELTSRALDQWAYDRGVSVGCTSSTRGSRCRTASWRALMARCATSALNDHWFTSLYDARGKVETWPVDYSTVRPHQSLGRHDARAVSGTSAGDPAPPRPGRPRGQRFSHNEWKHLGGSAAGSPR